MTTCREMVISEYELPINRPAACHAKVQALLLNDTFASTTIQRVSF